MSGEPPPADAAEPVAVAGNGEPVEVQDPASVPIEGTDQAGATPDEELKEDFSHLPDAERLGLDYTITSTIVAEYEGDMVEDQYHGQGKAKFANGAMYTGEFKKGFMDGQGTYVWADKTQYQGDFKMNRLTGKGKYTWVSGNVYEGEVLNGKRHGHGIFRLNNDPTFFEGEWRDGKRNGHGTCYYDAEQLEFFSGNWKDDVREGFGKMVYISGNTYEGEWHSNQRHGKGVMRWETTKEVYSGFWVDGSQTGEGLHVWFLAQQSGSQWQMQNSYQGQFANGKRNGFGLFKYADGSQYEGEYLDNQKHGTGEFLFADGEVHRGRFVRDRFVDYTPSEPPPNGTGMRKDVDADATVQPHPPAVDKPAATDEPAADKPSEEPKPSLSKVGKGMLYGALEMPLYINDLLEYERNPQAELLRTRNFVLQHNSELRQIFRYYASMHGTMLGRMPLVGRLIEFSPTLVAEQAMENVFCMSMLQFWKFTKDTKLPDHNLTLAAIDRIFIQLKRDGSRRGDDTPIPDVHNPQRSLVFREFVEGVIRLSDIKCAEAETISERLKAALETHILPYACKDNQNFYRALLQRPDVQDTLHSNEAVVINAWEKYSGDGPAQGTMNIRNFLRFLKDAALCAPSTTLSVTQSVDVFLRINSDDDEYLVTNQTNLELELIFSEFVEALLRLADALYKESLEDVNQRVQKVLQQIQTSLDPPAAEDPSR